MRSRRTSANQLALPAAAKIDAYGLHDYDCECTRCSLGHRPSAVARETARRVHERAAEHRRQEQLRAGAPVAPPAPEVSRAEAKHQRAHEREQRREAETREYLAAQRRPVQRPATPEELDELKRLHGFKTRRRDGT